MAAVSLEIYVGGMVRGSGVPSLPEPPFQIRVDVLEAEGEEDAEGECEGGGGGGEGGVGNGGLHGHWC